MCCWEHKASGQKSIKIIFVTNGWWLILIWNNIIPTKFLFFFFFFAIATFRLPTFKYSNQNDLHFHVGTSIGAISEINTAHSFNKIYTQQPLHQVNLFFSPLCLQNCLSPWYRFNTALKTYHRVWFGLVWTCSRLSFPTALHDQRF